MKTDFLSQVRSGGAILLIDSSSVNAAVVPYPVDRNKSGPPNVVMAGRQIILDGVVPQLALPGNPNRKRLLLMNMNIAQVLYFEYGSPANADSFQLPALGNIDEDTNVPTGDVWIFSTLAGHKVKVSEGT